MLRLFGRLKDEEEQRDQLLSAYLDGELSAGERERLEARLSRDPSLRGELRAMQRTVSLMRELPQVAAPRNFILTESLVERREPVARAQRARPGSQQRTTAWTAPLLTAATTVVSLLFIFVLVGDLLLPGVGGLVSAPAPLRQADEAPKVALEAAPTREGPPGEAEMEKYEADDLPSPPASSREPDASLAGEQAREAPEMAAEEGEGEAEATRATQAPPGAGATPPPAGAGGAAEETGAPVVPTVPPTVTSVTAVTPTIPAEVPVVSEDELGLVEPTPSELEVTPAIREDMGTDGLELPPALWNVLEVALGLASVVLVFATIQAWRLRSR